VILQTEINKLGHKILPVNIFKKINFIKLNFCEIFNKVEFYIFYHCLNKRINEYLSLCHESQSIDALINSHIRLLKDIYLSIGVKQTVNFFFYSKFFLLEYLFVNFKIN